MWRPSLSTPTCLGPRNGGLVGDTETLTSVLVRNGGKRGLGWGAAVGGKQNNRKKCGREEKKKTLALSHTHARGDASTASSSASRDPGGGLTS